MYGMQPEIAAYINIKRASNNGHFCRGLFVFGNIVVASDPSDMARTIAMFCMNEARERLIHKAKTVELTPEQVVKLNDLKDKLDVNSSSEVINGFTGAFVNATKRYTGGGKSQSYIEDFYGDVLNLVISSAKSYFAYIDKDDGFIKILDDGIAGMLGYLKLNWNNTAIDVMRKRMRTVDKNVTPDEEAMDAIEHGVLPGERNVPGQDKMDIEEEVQGSIRNLWMDVQPFLASNLSKFVDQLIKEFKDSAPRSPLAGYDPNVSDYTDKAEDEAEKQWTTMITGLFVLIRAGILRTQKPLNHTQIGSYFNKHIDNKRQAALAKAMSMMFIKGAILREARKSYHGFKLEAVENFFEGLDNAYKRNIEEIRRRSSVIVAGENWMKPVDMVLELRSRRKNACDIGKESDLNNDNTEAWAKHITNDSTSDDSSIGCDNSFRERPYFVYNLAKKLTREELQSRCTS